MAFQACSLGAISDFFSPLRERQDLLLGLAKTVANNTAALVLKAKNVASKCEDQYTQNKVSEDCIDI